MLEGSVREAGALADRALVCAAEENTRLRSLEDTIDSRLQANLRASESNTAAAVTRVTANLSSWLSSSDARTDAKISQLPTHDQARRAATLCGSPSVACATAGLVCQACVCALNTHTPLPHTVRWRPWRAASTTWSARVTAPPPPRSCTQSRTASTRP